MNLNKNDFIEINFTAKIKDTGEVFDSNLKQELQKINLNIEAKPFIFSLGNNMFIKGIDDFLIGKSFESFPAEFNIEISPENAFGLRNSQLIYTMPIKIFREHNISPIPGSSLNFDGRIAKVLSVSGGRVIVDFNSPLAGKKVIYEIKILRKIEDINEKIKALNEFFFRKNFNFNINEKKLIIRTQKELKSLIELFKDKYKELVGLDLEVEEIEQEDKKEN